MAASDKLIRVRKGTADALEAVRQALIAGYEKGQRELTFDDRDRVSMDQVIGILIGQYWDHRERSIRSAKRKARKLLSELDAVRSESEASEETPP